MNAMSRRLALLAAAICVSSSLSTAEAHPGHYSLTEIEFNPQNQRFEVAMCVRIADLQDALAMQAQRRISLEHDPQAAAAVQKYVAANFQISASESDRCFLHWVGHELTLHDVWIYFEVQLQDTSTNQSHGGSASDDSTTVTRSRQSSQLLTRPGSNAAASSHRSATARWNDFLRPTRERTSVTVKNSMLFDVQPEQMNLVSVRSGGQTKSATLSAAKTDFRAFGETISEGQTQGAAAR
ncbi:MAG: hypothetical protein Fues2KO_24330 [Fuerstiella sp.]